MNLSTKKAKTFPWGSRRNKHPSGVSEQFGITQHWEVLQVFRGEQILYFKWFPYPKGPGSWTCLGFLPWTCPLEQGPSASTVRGWKPQSHCWRAWIPETTNMSSFPVTLGNEVEKGAGGWWWLWVKWLGGLERVWKNSGLWVVQKKHLLCA